MTQPIDPQLVDRARRRDHAALDQLLQGQQERLFNIVFRMVGHRDDAVKVTQDTMRHVVEHIGDSKQQSDIAIWMIRIAMDLSLSLCRQRQVGPVAKLDAKDATVGQDQLAPLRQQLAHGGEQGFESRLEKAQMGDLLQTCLDRLPDDLRGVLLLRDFDAMDHHQIAQVLELPIGTVKNRLFRARLAFRKELATCGRPSDRLTESPREPQPQRQQFGIARRESSFVPKEFNDG